MSAGPGGEAQDTPVASRASSSTKTTTKKTRTSWAWEHFKKNDAKTQVYCQLCPKGDPKGVLPYHGNTTNLIRHLQSSIHNQQVKECKLTGELLPIGPITASQNITVHTVSSCVCLSCLYDLHCFCCPSLCLTVTLV